MEVFESCCSVTHGSTVLVTIGTPMWQPVTVSGGIAFQKAQRVRADSAKMLARGNEFNSITFSICSENAGPAAASAAALAYAVALPKTTADVTIAFATTSLVLHDAVVSAWSVDTVEQLGRYTITLSGGKIAAV